jgi:hypothetical protein
MPIERQRRGFAIPAKPFEIQGILPADLGQSYPRHYPQKSDQEDVLSGAHKGSVLGDPLSIRDVADVIGCSPWTVRQRHLPQGLPCFRAGRAGKLIFYRNQVVAWILRQQKGGN